MYKSDISGLFFEVKFFFRQCHYFFDNVITLAVEIINLTDSSMSCDILSLKVKMAQKFLTVHNKENI